MSEGGVTRLSATLNPGLQIHVVGLKALAEAGEPQVARVYVDADASWCWEPDDLFVTLRYAAAWRRRALSGTPPAGVPGRAWRAATSFARDTVK
ncbi:MAG: hypothetical protein R3F43_05735 [bacterium]